MSGQDITLYKQFYGRYDFTFIGNTMNTAENNLSSGFVTTTSSSATLSLNSGNIVQKAYLYWAGSGDGDFEVKLNSTTITPDRTFNISQSNLGIQYTYFSAFKDITSIVQNTGNGNYTLSNLDISAFEELHFDRKTNFAGWAIVIVYKNENLPFNQINVYDGLQAVPGDLTINLNSLNVVTTNNSKAGFIAWEGDSALPTESFYFNNSLLNNTPLNPANNVFNGTNSITGSNTLYNMDLDIYDLQDYINVGVNSAQLRLTSFINPILNARDFIMINTVVTKFNIQFSDATLVINSVDKTCDSRTIVVNYTVSNFNSTGPIPAQTPIAIYINNQFFQATETATEIPINGFITSEIALDIPLTATNNFELKFVVDDDGDGTGIINESNENNNSFSVPVTLDDSPTFNTLENLISCNEGFTQATFDFSGYEDAVKTNPEDIVKFYETLEDALAETNPILNTTSYVATTTPKEIFVKINNQNCFATTSFMLTTRNCMPTVFNYVSANNDNRNDTFTIKGLQNIFLNYKIEIYNRWGKLVWTGNQNTQNWDGYIKEGLGTKNAPDGTYFYILYLNDPDYPQPINGYLYLVH